MRGEGKRNFLGIVMGGCGRYVFFFLWEGMGGMGMEGWFGSEMEWNVMYDV